LFSRPQYDHLYLNRDKKGRRYHPAVATLPTDAHLVHQGLEETTETMVFLVNLVHLDLQVLLELIQLFRYQSMAAAVGVRMDSQAIRVHLGLLALLDPKATQAPLAIPLGKATLDQQDPQDPAALTELMANLVQQAKLADTPKAAKKENAADLAPMENMVKLVILATEDILAETATLDRVVLPALMVIQVQEASKVEWVHLEEEANPARTPSIALALGARRLKWPKPKPRPRLKLRPRPRLRPKPRHKHHYDTYFYQVTQLLRFLFDSRLVFMSGCKSPLGILMTFFMF